MRGHAADPTWRTDVIRIASTATEMQWSRWIDWRAGDPRWRVHVIDTSAVQVEEVAARLIEWILEERALLKGTQPRRD
jgi:hypothetical protein